MPISKNSSYFTKLVNKRYSLEPEFHPDFNIGMGDAPGEFSALRCHSPKGELVHELFVQCRHSLLLSLGITRLDTAFLAHEISFEEECFFLKTSTADYFDRLCDIHAFVFAGISDVKHPFSGVHPLLCLNSVLRDSTVWSMNSIVSGTRRWDQECAREAYPPCPNHPKFPGKIPV